MPFGTIQGSDDGMAKIRDPVVAVVRWVKSRSPREKTVLGAFGGFLVSRARGLIFGYTGNLTWFIVWQLVPIGGVVQDVIWLIFAASGHTLSL